ncbi:hypothetical protein CR513_23898, partial [Mucuna pruriens]
MQVRRIYIRCVVAILVVPYCFFPIRVVSELPDLKGVLRGKIMEGNTNRIFKEGTFLSDHLNEFQEIIDQMSGIDIKFEDEILRLLLLNSLPESWETFKGSVLNEGMRRKTQSSSSQSKVLVTENKGRTQKNEREKSRSKSKYRYKNVEYHYCHKTGHIQKHYFLWKKKNKGKKGKSKEKDDDNDDDHVTTAIGDDLVILRNFESVN